MRQRGWPIGLRDRLAWRSIRYLDKTTANCFHTGFLKQAFPDAIYLVLHRDGRAAISSMIEGWDELQFVETLLAPYLEKRGTRSFHWSFSTPPGWSDQIGREIEEVCAWSWAHHVEAILQGTADVDRSRVRVIRYEDLVGQTATVLRDLYRLCGLTWTADTQRHVDEKPLSRTTVSRPDPMKWRAQHGLRIERILPQIESTMRRIGYAAQR